MFGLPESGLADTLREAEAHIGGFERLEITTCLRRGEIEMVTRYEPDAATVYADLMRLLHERHGGEIFSEDGATVDDQVAALLAGRTIATAESCTAGLVAARLTDLPGSSAYVAGSGVVLERGQDRTSRRGPGTHRSARRGVGKCRRGDGRGALRRFAADTAIAITGIAGPGGGSEDKPVGTVCFCVKLADGTTDVRRMRLPGNRSDVRERSTTVAMHLLRRALA